MILRRPHSRTRCLHGDEILNSHIIRFGPEVGVRIALRALADHLDDAYWDNHTSDGRCKYPKTCEADGCHPEAGES